MKHPSFNLSLAIVIIFHFVGLCGLLSPYQSWFLMLTPFNLMLSAFLLFRQHATSTMPLLYFFAITFLVGFFVEYLGVNFGWLFGSYTYGRALGLKFLNVPIVIGLNWVLIIYSAAVIVDRVNFSVWIKILLGSCLAVFLDFWIEPMAMRYDFWNWEHGLIPFQNYVGWFATSLVMMSAYYLLGVNAKNRLALPFYIVQVIFFVGLQLANFFLRA